MIPIRFVGVGVLAISLFVLPAPSSASGACDFLKWSERSGFVRTLPPSEIAKCDRGKPSDWAECFAIAAGHYGGIEKNYFFAIQFLDCAIEHDPNEYNHYSNRAWYRYLMGYYVEALGDAERALAMKPNQPETLDTRGRIFAALGSQAEAIADLRRALAIKGADMRPDAATRLPSAQELLDSLIKR